MGPARKPVSMKSKPSDQDKLMAGKNGANKEEEDGMELLDHEVSSKKNRLGSISTRQLGYSKMFQMFACLLYIHF
jgi:hypothetical protein